jgi:hypothetical protein
MFKSADENLAQQNLEKPSIWKHWQHRAYEPDWGRRKPAIIHPGLEMENRKEKK